MRILIQTPAKTGSRKGNRITAQRWARYLRELNHAVVIRSEISTRKFDLLIALHAIKSACAIEQFRKTNPHSKIFLALTGTDIYRDPKKSNSESAQKFKTSIGCADKLILLNHDAAKKLSRNDRQKATVILQSAEPPRNIPPALKRSFEIVVAGHLREVKDPFLAAQAARALPSESRIRITHLGKALTPAMRRLADKEASTNSRYRWLGEKSNGETKRIIARAKLLVVSSIIEGGAAAISEALVSGTPVLATAISGNIGILGNDYAGLFKVGGVSQLQKLMWSAETDSQFYKKLQKRCRRVATRLHPKQEKIAWQKLLQEAFD